MQPTAFADGFQQLKDNIEGFVRGNSTVVHLALVCLGKIPVPQLDRAAREP